MTDTATCTFKVGDKLKLKDDQPLGNDALLRTIRSCDSLTVKELKWCGEPQVLLEEVGGRWHPFASRFILAEPEPPFATLPEPTKDTPIEESHHDWDELESTQAALAAKTEELERTRATLDNATADLHLAQSDCDELVNDLRDSQSEQQRLCTALTKLEEQLDSESKRADEQVKAKKNLQNTVSDLAAQNAKLFGTTESLLAQIRTQATPQPGDVVYDKMTGKRGVLIDPRNNNWGSEGRVPIYRGMSNKRDNETHGQHGTVHDTAFPETLTLTPPTKRRLWPALLLTHLAASAGTAAGLLYALGAM